MPNQNLLHLPILSAVVLLHVILSPPTLSFSLSPPQRRVWTPLRASSDVYDDHDYSSNEEKEGNVFERVVRSVTGNEEYTFGDITKTVANTTATTIEGAVKAVTHDEDYHFGDFTKSAIGSTTHGFEDIVRSATGNEDYQFGDLAKGAVHGAGTLMTYSEKSLAAIRDHNIHELIEVLNMFWSKSMNEDERTEAFTVAIYLGAIVILAYNFVANVMAGMVFASAWTKVSMATGASPLAQGNWKAFLRTKSTLDILFGGPFVPARAIITIPWFFSYRRFVVFLANRSPLRAQFPVINRYLSLILSWLIANLAIVGGLTFFMVKMGSAYSGVPMV